MFSLLLCCFNKRPMPALDTSHFINGPQYYNHQPPLNTVRHDFMPDITKLDLSWDNAARPIPELQDKQHKVILNVIIGKQFFPRYYRLQVNPATPRERRVQAHLELAELVAIPRTLTCYVEIGHAIGFFLPRNRD
ncbi:hypothetical protein NQ317_016798 [Molorchus minor]|uniref:Uncharacterized protein n=1 Tax=Molorchus minor TaxID=1323400 RepID=A0ABQ9J2H6_9CUCU|nr:hypothetical protein NQ317_016798 [Molorchus minor]